MTDGGLILVQRLRELTDALDVEPIKLLGATATPFRADPVSFPVEGFELGSLSRTCVQFG
jgi:hypothetical protein